MLKIVLLALTMTLAASAAGDAKPTSRPAGLPAGAERVTDQQWRHTDAKGKSWIYTRTPFGWSRGPEEKPEEKKDGKEKTEADPASTGPALEVVEVREKEVVFQRATPFGRSRWTKAKSALNEAEQAALDAARK